MSPFLFSVLAGFFLYQLAALIQPIAGSRTYKIGRRVVIQLPERSYLVWKAGIIAVTVILFFAVITIILTQKFHPAEGYAYRFTDALVSPRMGAAIFGGLIGVLVGNLLNRILQNPNDYKLTSSDRLEILLIFALLILGIGGEEFLRSYTQRISKISIGTTTEISFSEGRPRASRAAAEQPNTAFRAITAYGDKIGVSPGLAKLAKLEYDITTDKQFIEVLRLFEPRAGGPNPVEVDAAQGIQHVALHVISPIAACFSRIFYWTGDTAFINKQLSELSPALQAIATGVDLEENAEKRLEAIVNSLSQYNNRIDERIKRGGYGTKRTEVYKSAGDCTKIDTAAKRFGSIFAPIGMFENMSVLANIAAAREKLPYASMAYASLMAALGHHEAASVTMHNWIQLYGEGQQLPGSWYVIRARFALSNYLEEWIRERGLTAPAGLRQYHAENLKMIVVGMKAFQAIWDMEQASRNYKLTVGLLGASHSGDEGSCKFPSLPEAARSNRRLSAAEERDLSSLFESYLSARSYLADALLKHPVTRRKQAAIIQSQVEELMSLDLRCVTPAGRLETRAEHLERYVRNEINLLEHAAPIKSSDEVRNRIARAQQIVGLAFQLIEPAVSKARERRLNAEDLATQVASDSSLELYETLLATQDQLQSFSEREAMQ